MGYKSNMTSILSHILLYMDHKSSLPVNSHSATASFWPWCPVIRVCSSAIRKKWYALYVGCTTCCDSNCKYKWFKKVCFVQVAKHVELLCNGPLFCTETQKAKKLNEGHLLIHKYDNLWSLLLPWNVHSQERCAYQ